MGTRPKKRRVTLSSRDRDKKIRKARKRIEKYEGWRAFYEAMGWKWRDYYGHGGLRPTRWFRTYQSACGYLERLGLREAS